MEALARAARITGAASGADAADPLSGTIGPPFPLTLGPERAVPHRAWCKARNQVLAALHAGSRLVLVIGPAGTGKTLLLQEIARTLRTDGCDVLLQSRGDLPLEEDAAMTDGAARHRRRVVLVDEADRMNEATLERLGALGECAIVLAGQGLAAPGGGSPSAAVATVVRLAALPPGEVAAFVAARLAQAGMHTDLLSREAVARLAEQSGGVPRVLNMLARAALLLARAEGAPRVAAAHVDQAAALRGGDAEAGTTPPPEVAQAVPGVAPRREESGPLSSPAAVDAAPGAPPLGMRAAEPARSPAPPVSLPDLARGHRHRGVAAVLCAGIAAAACGAWLAFWPGDGQRRWRAPPPTVAVVAGSSEQDVSPSPPTPSVTVPTSEPLDPNAARASSPVAPESAAAAVPATPRSPQETAARRPVPNSAQNVAALGTATRLTEPARAKGGAAAGRVSAHADPTTTALSSHGTDRSIGPALNHRCRNILVRAQLGEEPSYVDRSLLRNGCRIQDPDR